MLSPRSIEVRETLKRALNQTLTALDQAQTDDDIQLVIDVVEGYGKSKVSDRLRPLADVTASLTVASKRLDKITKR
jgi:hypothetical protein